MAESAEGVSPCRGAHPKRSKAIKPKSKRFMVSLLDGLILKKLPYEKITER
jgi:hypothetical protein